MRKLISTGSPFEKTMGYSRAVAQGPFCFVSGTTGYDYTKMQMPDDVAVQAEMHSKQLSVHLPTQALR